MIKTKNNILKRLANAASNTSLSSKRTLHIHVVQHLKPGGIESLVLEILHHKKHNQQILIVSLEGDRLSAIAHWPKLEPFKHQLLFLNKPQGLSYQCYRTLNKLFEIVKPDVVHTHHIGPLIYAGIAAKNAHVACRIHTEHDAWHLTQPKRAFVQRVALKLAKPFLVADAQLVKQKLDERFDYPKTRVIKNGIDCDRFKPASQSLARQQLGLPLEPVIIGSAGRLEHVKGHDVLIQALTMLPKHYHLAIAGSGSQAHTLKDLAAQCGVSERIIWLGQVDNMPRFYQSLDLFCLPSRCEGFPLATLEAQACNIKALASDVGASNETLCPHTGMSFAPDNPIRLAAAILKQLSANTVVQPRTFVLEHNNITKMISDYQSIQMEA
ncbi:glycosyltransferase [Vibrio sp. LaRot3]|uniref:glycosyltransferase n=1 Tax=Vibrio sp. LaRot3 TaxID=2998829 RepID=UPI0022CE0508|nr:glycosyltransferase [Vibrio sp. LaRot3]MDA0147615.1 glycosyltransferase [Vibrio sp. LaRot3]